MLTLLSASIAIAQGRTLNVFAAASLKEAFTTIAHRYETSHPGLTVTLSFGGSQALASQINQGAPADVFASAARKNLDDILHDKASERIFVQNRLEIAIRKGLGVASIGDLDKVKDFVIADPAVPVGHYTESFFAKAAGVYGPSWLARLRSHVMSREQDVKAVLTKVELGEADAGIVYESDVTTANGRVESISIPANMNVIVDYPVAIPASAQSKDEAKHFIKFLLDSDSQRMLEQSGFVSPTRPVGTLTILAAKTTYLVPLPLSTKQLIVQAIDERKQTRNFQGVPVTGLPGFKTSQSATFIGADGYAQTVSIADLRTRKAILARNPDGNYQLVVPGMKPNVWVNWLRRIVLR